MPEPGRERSASATQAYRWMGPSPGTTARVSDALARGPRRTTVSGPSWSATSSVTRAFAVAVVANTGRSGRAAMIRASRW